MGLVDWARRDAFRSEAAPASVSAQRPEPKVEAEAPKPPPNMGPDTATQSWDDLQRTVAGCTRCALAQHRHNTVFGVGSRSASWMIVGEAPGAEEDRRGEPFVGRAGKLLDAILEAMGTSREEVFITNIVKCRPPGNRDPKPEEAAACRDYLQAQIETVDPALLLAVGRIAAHHLLGVETSVGRLRGKIHEGPGGRPVVVTYHPAYLLRTPTAKRKVWADLQLARSRVPVHEP